MKNTLENKIEFGSLLFCIIGIGFAILEIGKKKDMSSKDIWR